MNEAEILIEKLMNYYGVFTISELGKQIDITQPSISQWKKKNYVKAIATKCKELGIYDEIFKVGTNFNQFGSNSQQIKAQHNNNSIGINNFSNAPQENKENEEIYKICDALISTANALNKKEILKNELTSLIAKLVIL